MKYPYEAIYYYKKAADLKPNDVRMWNALETCYKSFNRYDEANFCSKRALACDDNGKIEAMYQLGRLFLSMNRKDAACYYYRWFWDNARAYVS